jgi:hypothetical protein
MMPVTQENVGGLPACGIMLVTNVVKAALERLQMGIGIDNKRICSRSQKLRLMEGRGPNSRNAQRHVFPDRPCRETQGPLPSGARTRL